MSICDQKKKIKNKKRAIHKAFWIEYGDTDHVEFVKSQVW